MPDEQFKRYVVVFIEQYYPCGFEDDVHARFSNLDEAKKHLLDWGNPYDAAYVFDLIEWKQVIDD